MWKTKKSSKKCLQNDYAYVLMVAYGQTVNKNNNNNRSLERWIFSMNSINKNNKKGFTIIEVVLLDGIPSATCSTTKPTRYATKE